MAYVKNTAEGGTNGVTVTTGNSGGNSGTAFVQVSAVGAPTYTFSNTVSAHGSLSYHVSGTTGDQLRMYLGNIASPQAAARVYVYFPALPNATQSIIVIQNATFAFMASIGLSTSNRIIVSDNVGTLYTAPSSIVAGNWYRMELQVIAGASTTTGTIQFQYYDLDSTTPLGTFASTTANVTLDNPLRVVIGKQTITTAIDVYYDDIAYDDTTSTPIGVYTTNSPPICNAGSNQPAVEPYTTVSLIGSDSDPDGPIATRQWRQVSGTPTVTLSSTTTAVCLYTAPGTIGGTTLVFGYRVTDGNGTNSIESTVQHTILAASERAAINGVEVPAHMQSVQNGTLR